MHEVICTHMDDTTQSRQNTYAIGPEFAPLPRIIRNEIATYYAETHQVLEISRYHIPELRASEACIVLIDKRDAGKRRAEWEYPLVDLYVNLV